MAPPHGKSLPSSFSKCNNNNSVSMSKPPRLSSDHHIQRTISDMSFELTKEGIDLTLPPITEVVDAKCECCGMSEECTPEYIERVRDKFLGKWVCGLCAEAVKEELEKNGGKKEEALSSHMSACVRFNKYGRAFPVLFQAEAMKEMLKKNKMEGRRAKSFNPRDKGGYYKGGIARSSSCIPAITREMNGLTFAN
ncbi:hypothetical protein AAZX31_13G336100 [Glycine max]|uniref:DUF1677 family protein n=2 Tax=Glycine subgen. Soja TaxID=1462606 RepID=I1M5H2_SOYBN|nr:uncharacterized protein LOC100783355 [Glycine max]XP_028189070.1 uncharacterized protein LOC114375483 [Glycine soja]KAG4961532.1 hypothetical protein JHK87_038165 [Glycine soja]KAG4972538.1 hypothetical protein JHK85_038959 [Glycine max]KAG4978925.1 hypothetical protein JHK86_038399 [Glycine max]KAG5114940.1 hypothetical protein JHK82_038209 [Glycine max]KAG5132221.1 hypothetical protein JHK84_038618 [Glycine max]|eukprot:XP_003542088.1 uncharacterized protein LOC100783355 [Glycine max]